jgi:hypothetical protein
MQPDMPHSESEPAPLGTFTRELQPSRVTSTGAVSISYSSFFYPREQDLGTSITTSSVYHPLG